MPDLQKRRTLGLELTQVWIDTHESFIRIGYWTHLTQAEKSFAVL